jgi:UDPglucose 6-dehydrogenase
MKITVAGAGYVGLATSVCFAEMGHQVTCIDIDKDKINMLQNGQSPIYEPGLESFLEKYTNKGQLKFTVNPKEAYPGAEIISIAVGTPEKEDGSVDLKAIYVVSHTIAHFINSDVIVCTKSNVPVGTNDVIRQIINIHKPVHINADVVSNPEFFRTGSAIIDFFHADRIVIGTDNPEAASIMEQLYLPLKIPILKTDIKSAEMIKYTSNAFLVTKISFINEIATLCEKIGANIEEVAFGIGFDKRIGQDFLKAGIGYGGSCFPRDTRALLQLAGNVDHSFELLESVMKVNNFQHIKPVKIAKQIMESLRYKKVALLGLSFKPDTDDIRGAPSISIIKELLKEGAAVTAFDPVAIPNAQQLFGNSIEYTIDIRSALKNAELAIIATEWEQIKHLPLDVYPSKMRKPFVIDGRNCYDLDEIRKYPISYISIGRPPLRQPKKEKNLWREC